MIAGHMETTPIELTDPAFDRNFPVGMAVEKTADDADADRLARCRHGGKGRRRKPARDHFADHLAINLLQCAVIAALVREQEGMSSANSLNEIALKHPAFDIIEQIAQFLFVGATALRDFAFVPIDDRQFGEASGKPRVRMTWLERKRLSEIATRFFISADFEKTTTALVPGLGIARIKF